MLTNVSTSEGVRKDDPVETGQFQVCFEVFLLTYYGSIR